MIIEKLSQLPNGVEETNGSVVWEGDVYSQVLNVVIGPERNNQVRGIGRTPKPFKFLSHVQDKTYFEDDHDVCIEKMECLLKKMKDNFEDKLRENANAQAMMYNEIKMLKEVVFARRIFEDYNI